MRQSDHQPPEFLWNACPIPGCFSAVESLNLLADNLSDENVQIKWIDHSASPEIFSGADERLFRVGAAPQPIAARALGSSLKVVGISLHRFCSGIAVRADSPLKSVEDLRGKRVFVPRGMPQGTDFIPAAPYVSFLECLDANGLGIQDVEYAIFESKKHELPPTYHDAQVKFGADENPGCKALLSGEVDAIQTSSHQAGRLLVEGKIRMLYDLKDHAEFSTVNVTTVAEKTVEQYPEVVSHFLEAQIKVAAWAQEHPDELITRMAESAGVSIEAIKRSHAPGFHMHMEPSFSEKNIDALKAKKDFMKKKGLIKNDFDLESWLDPAPFARAIKAVGD